MHVRRTTRALGAFALGLALALTACGGDDATDSGPVAKSATEHNEADVSFASEMIPHHTQALEMVDLTRGRPLDPAVAELAGAIRDAQAPEIESMTDWLTTWGEPVPETSRDHANADSGASGDSSGMGGMGDMPGMMSDQEMADLQAAGDADFQGLWLRMMVEHHEGAVEMATAELTDGQYQPAADLAQAIITGQEKEIATMKGLLS
jgi:uncharacterized protein (DUF305 family)